MAIRIQVNTDGSSTTSDPSQPNVEERATEALVPTETYRQGGERHRYDAATGAMVVLSDGRDHRNEQHHAPLKSRSGVTVMSEAGTPTTLAQATPNSVVNIPGLGETNVKTAVALGYLQERASGRGFELSEAALEGLAAVAPQQQAIAKQEQQEAAQQDVTDLKGVPATSARTDALVDTLSTNVPAAFEGMLSSIAAGKMPTALIADAARALGDEALPEKFNAMHREFIASSQKALSNVGVADFADYESWMIENHPDEAADAVRDLVVNRSVGKLTASGRRYVAQAATKVARLIQSKGVDTEVRDGVVYVSRAHLGMPALPRGDFMGSPWVSVKDAVRGGHLVINGG